MPVPSVFVWRCKVCMGAVVPVCCEARDPCPGACPWGERRNAEWVQLERRYLQPGDWIVRVQTLRQRGEDVGPLGPPEEGRGCWSIKDMERRGVNPYDTLPMYTEEDIDKGIWRRPANLFRNGASILRRATNTSCTGGEAPPSFWAVGARGSARGPRR